MHRTALRVPLWTELFAKPGKICLLGGLAKEVGSCSSSDETLLLSVHNTSCRLGTKPRELNFLLVGSNNNTWPLAFQGIPCGTCKRSKNLLARYGGHCQSIRHTSINVTLNMLADALLNVISGKKQAKGKWFCPCMMSPWYLLNFILEHATIYIHKIMLFCSSAMHLRHLQPTGTRLSAINTVKTAHSI